MKHFVREDSIVRKIWGDADTILFIFAGSSAEFAVNKSVDWLYFTGRLPADPIGRLFSTVSYARRIIFAGYDEAVAAIEQITAIHKSIETKRGFSIPDWAYRDVLYMLIDYSIRSFEILNRKLTLEEKVEVFDVFSSMGIRMGLKDLPASYAGWLESRNSHLMEDLAYSAFSADLYKQYQKHLGKIRFLLLKQVQQLLVPIRVSELLALNQLAVLNPVLAIYKMLRLINLDSIIKKIILPGAYKKQFLELENQLPLIAGRGAKILISL